MENAFRLSDLLKSLRDDLEATRDAGTGSDFALEIGTVELEVEVVAGTDRDAKLGAGWWVLTAEASGKLSNARTQRLRLQLQPVDRNTGKPAHVSGGGEAPPPPPND